MSQLECIECGSDKIEKETISQMATKYECQKCGKVWKNGVIG